MSNTKHTPGPWIYKAVDDNKLILIGEAGGQEACFCSVFPQPSLGVDIKTTNANAKLISAAPELLESVKQFVWNWENDIWTDADIEAAKEVIKKATQ